MNDDELIICRCEEITMADIKRAIALGARDLDAVKRMTRAGMGLCQGRTCSELVRRILSEELRISKKNLSPATTRTPLRLIPSDAFLKALE
jgi:NAD(P)H-nitrite reductase large subunit